MVQRTTLKQLMPDAAAVFKNLTASVELREPAFRTVVIIYRRKGGAPDASIEPVRPGSHNQILESYPRMPGLLHHMQAGAQEGADPVLQLPGVLIACMRGCAAGRHAGAEIVCC